MYKEKYAKTAGSIPKVDHYAIVTSGAECGIDDGYGGTYTTEFVIYQYFLTTEKQDWMDKIDELEKSNKSYTAGFVKVAKVTKSVNINIE